MKKGIAITAVLVVFIVLTIVAYMVIPARAATGTTHVLAIHKAMGSGFGTVGNAYAIITDLSNADMMHASTGVADATYGNCDVEFTADLQNTDWALATAPALDTSKRYAITIYENSSATAGDTAVIGPLLYDPINGITYTDTNPLDGSILRVRQTQYGR